MELKKMYDKINKILEGNDKQPHKTLEEIRKILEVEILTSGKSNVTIKKAFKDFLATVSHRPNWQSLNKNESGNYVLCNGFYLIEFETDEIPPELIPYKKEDLQNFSFDKSKNNDTPKTGQIHLADVLKVVKYNKIHKDDNIPFIVNGDFWLNPEYILQIAAILKIKNEIKIEYGNNIAPATIVGNKAIILPIRPGGSFDIEKTNKTFNEIINIKEAV